MRVATWMMVGLMVSLGAACASSEEKKDDGKAKLKAAQDEVAAAEKAQDVAKLKAICETEGHLAGTMACRSATGIMIKNQDMDQLLSDCAAQNRYATNESCKAGTDLFKQRFEKLTTPCGNVSKVWESHYKFFKSGKLQAAQADVLTHFVKRGLACGQGDVVFGAMITGSQGGPALKAAAEGDAPLRRVLIQFLRANPKTPFGNDLRKGSMIFEALVGANKVGDCAEFDQFAKEADERYIHQIWAPMFAKTKCVAAAKTVATLLDARASQRRIDGCNLLAEMGAKKMMKKMKKLTKKDRTVVDQGGKKVYTVRKACAEAFVKLKKM